MRILIADDCNTTRMILCRSVQRWGYEVVEVKDGEEALQTLLAERDIKLAVLDWEMPGLTGPEVCKAVLDEGHLVYAVLLTGRGGNEALAQAMDSGASDYVEKPFNPTELRARLHAGERLLNLQTQVQRMQRMDAIGRLAAGIAHELNTPAQFVQDNLQFLRESFEDVSTVLAETNTFLESLGETEADGLAKVREAMEDADIEFLEEEIPRALEQSRDGLQQVTKIVAAMKHLTHCESGDIVPVDLNETVHTAATMTHNQWEDVAELELDLDAVLPRIQGRPGELIQVLINMFVNAAQAISRQIGDSPAEKGRITVATRRVDDQAELRLGDTGTGIPPEIRERIFEPFFTTNEVGSGTGQGLSIVHDVVVQQSGGSIEIESEVGSGATFIVRIPHAGDIEATDAAAA